jgi:hypothetical protein
MGSKEVNDRGVIVEDGGYFVDCLACIEADAASQAGNCSGTVVVSTHQRNTSCLLQLGTDVQLGEMTVA